MLSPKLFLSFCGVVVILVVVASSPVLRPRATIFEAKDGSSGAGEVVGKPPSGGKRKDQLPNEEEILFPNYEDYFVNGGNPSMYDFAEPSDMDYDSRIPGVDSDEGDRDFDEEDRKDDDKEDAGDEKGIAEPAGNDDDTDEGIDEDEGKPLDEDDEGVLDEEEANKPLDGEDEGSPDEDEAPEKPSDDEDENGSDEEEKGEDDNEDEGKDYEDSDDVHGKEGKNFPEEDETHGDEEEKDNDIGLNEIDENSAEEGLPGIGGGFILDTPFFNIKQVTKYFKQLERALESVFRQTLDDAILLNGTYANTTEEEVEIDGRKYLVEKSIIKAGDNNSSIYIEAISSQEGKNLTQVADDSGL